MLENTENHEEGRWQQIRKVGRVMKWGTVQLKAVIKSAAEMAKEKRKIKGLEVKKVRKVWQAYNRENEKVGFWRREKGKLWQS